SHECDGGCEAVTGRRCRRRHPCSPHLLHLAIGLDCAKKSAPLPARGVNSAEECHPHTVEVVGSNPTRPTIFSAPCLGFPTVGEPVLREGRRKCYLVGWLEGRRM